MSTYKTELEPKTELERAHQLRPRIRVSTSWLLPLSFSLLYFADVLLRSKEKYFWYDELFTLYLCRLPRVSDIFHALRHAVDFNPPLFYVLTRITRSFLGETRLGMRAPEILGFWLFCMCLFWFVKRHSGPAAGFVAMILPIFTGAFYFAYEARPYGLVLGFCGLALICWQTSIEKSRRTWWLIGFSLSLAAAFMSHCYAFFIAFPFVAVEAFRAIRFRRLDSAMWLALIAPTLAAGLFSFVLFRSFGSLAKGTDFMNLSPPIWAQVPAFYVFLLSPCLLIVLGALILLTFKSVLDFHFSAGPNIGDGETVIPEILIAVFFLTLPVLLVVAARIVSSPFISRYCIWSVAGVSILIGVGIGARKSSNWPAVTLAAILSLAAVYQIGRIVSNRHHGQVESLDEPSSRFSMNMSLGDPLDQYSQLLSQTGKSVPIAVLEPLDFLYLVHYAPDLVPRLYYVQSVPDDFFYRGFRNLRAWDHIAFNPPLTREEFLHLSPFSFVYGTDRVSQLEPFFFRGGRIEALKLSNGHFLAELKTTR